jgi:hypothetical protein
MKKVLFTMLALVLAIGLAIPTAAPALADGPGTITVVSNAGTNYKYWALDGSTFPASASIAPTESTNTDFTGYAEAIAYQDTAWTVDPSAAPFAAGTQWIAPYLVWDASQGKWRGGGPDFEITNNSRGVYTYKKVFTIPAFAYIVSAKAAIGGDNYAWLYLNGNLILSPRDSNQSDANYVAPPSSTASIPASYFSNGDNVLVAEVQNGISNGARHGPTGVVFSLEVTYDFPTLGDVTPAEAFNPVGANHTVSVQVTPAAAGVVVTFVVGGPNAQTGTGTTNASGVATFTYTGNNPGTDTIYAFIDLNGNGDYDEGEPHSGANATKYWLGNFVTGGGNYKEGKTVKYTFGGNVGFLPDGTIVGQFQIVDHANKISWHCHNDFDSLVFYPLPIVGPPGPSASHSIAAFTGTFTNNKGGSALLTIEITDVAEPGAGYDTIFVTSADGGPNFGITTISGGNFQVHDLETGGGVE